MWLTSFIFFFMLQCCHECEARKKQKKFKKKTNFVKVATFLRVLKTKLSNYVSKDFDQVKLNLQKKATNLLD